jgi:hypothetical protein
MSVDVKTVNHILDTAAAHRNKDAKYKHTNTSIVLKESSNVTNASYMHARAFGSWKTSSSKYYSLQ